MKKKKKRIKNQRVVKKNVTEKKYIYKFLRLISRLKWKLLLQFFKSSTYLSREFIGTCIEFFFNKKIWLLNIL